MHLPPHISGNPNCCCFFSRPANSILRQLTEVPQPDQVYFLVSKTLKNTQIHKITNTQIQKYKNTSTVSGNSVGRGSSTWHIWRYNYSSSESEYVPICINAKAEYKVVSHCDFYVEFDDCPDSFFETFQEQRDISPNSQINLWKQRNGEHPPKPVCPSSQPRECAQLEDRHQPRLPLPRHHPIYCGWGKGDGDDWSKW